MEDKKVDEETIVARCFERIKAPASSICYPEHRCDLDEDHEGLHVCDCGRKFRTLLSQ